MRGVLDQFEINRRASIVSERERRKWFIAAREQKERREDLAERADEALLDFAAAFVLATPEEVVQFQTKLDDYDRATVQALLENTEALDEVRATLQEMLLHAHVMEDGRRVFKSEDGTWAVDQDGNKLDPEKDDLDSISKTPVTAEQYLDFKHKERLLEAEREQLIDYQDKLDAARERSEGDDFSKEEMDEWEAELESSMPVTVKKQLPEFSHHAALTSKAAFASSAKPAASEQDLDRAVENMPMPG